MPIRRDRAVIAIGIVSGVAIGIGAWLGAFRLVPFLGALLSRRSAVAVVAAIVLWFAAWVLVALLVRHRRAGKELKVLYWAQLAAAEVTGAQLAGGIDRQLQAGIWRKTPTGREEPILAAYRRSHLARRVALIEGRLADHNRSERLSFLTAGLSGLEAAESESFFGLLRALIWAMPGLGFMGTALEMAGAVGGMGQSLAGTANYQSLQKLLANDVIPHLAEAFYITLFALGASVACFLVLALVHRKEEQVLNTTDGVFLTLIAKLEDERPAPVPGGGGRTTLEDEIRQLRTGLTVVGAELSKLNEFLAKGSAAMRNLFAP